MEFELSGHARQQVIERLITEAMIDAVLAEPVRAPTTGRGTRYVGVVPDGRMLTVVVDRRERLRVVTVWWTQKGR